MHNIAKIIVFSTIVLSICLTIMAQEKVDSANQTITKEEFYAAFNKAVEKTQTKKHRIKYTSENDSPTANEKRLLSAEFVPPNRQRKVYDFYENANLRRYEEMQIGDVVYVKYDAETWRKKTEENTYSGYGRGSETKTEYLLMKNQTVNNQTTKLYEETEISSYPNLPNSRPTIETKKCWINSEGLIVKYSRSTTDGALGKLINRTEDYEYDSTIQINAPTVKSVRQKSLKKR